MMADVMPRVDAAPNPPPAAGRKLREIGRQGARCLPALSGEHRALLCRPGGTSALLARLQDARLLADAVSLLGYALPEREAVWWACMCVEQSAPAGYDPAQQRVLLATREWVRCPDDATKAQCLQAAKAVGAVGAAALAARAALAANLPDPVSLHAGRRVERSVAEAVALNGAEQSPFWRERFLLIGHDIAAGGAGRTGQGRRP